MRTANSSSPPDQKVVQPITCGEISPQRTLAVPFEVDTIYNLLKSASIDGDRIATCLNPPPNLVFKHVLPGYLKPSPSA